MSLKNNFHWRTSLKLRVAISYALLFFISCAVIFLFVSYIIYASLITSGDSSITYMADELEKEYIFGTRYGLMMGEVVEKGELPEKDRILMETEIPGIQILYVSRGKYSSDPEADDESNTYYIAIGYANGNFYEMRRQQDDKLDPIQLNTLKNYPLLKRHFELLEHARGRSNFFVRLINKNGKYLIATPLSNKLPGDTPNAQIDDNIDNLFPSAVAQAEFRIIRRELPDGNNPLRQEINGKPQTQEHAYPLDSGNKQFPCGRFHFHPEVFVIQLITGGSPFIRNITRRIHGAQFLDRILIREYTPKVIMHAEQI